MSEIWFSTINQAPSGTPPSYWKTTGELSLDNTGFLHNTVLFLVNTVLSYGELMSIKFNFFSNLNIIHYFYHHYENHLLNCHIQLSSLFLQNIVYLQSMVLW